MKIRVYTSVFILSITKCCIRTDNVYKLTRLFRSFSALCVLCKVGADAQILSNKSSLVMDPKLWPITHTRCCGIGEHGNEHP